LGEFLGCGQRIGDWRRGSPLLHRLGSHRWSSLGVEIESGLECRVREMEGEGKKLSALAKTAW
jgi:hypothetical protein